MISECPSALKQMWEFIFFYFLWCSLLPKFHNLAIPTEEAGAAKIPEILRLYKIIYVCVCGFRPQVAQSDRVCTLTPTKTPAKPGCCCVAALTVRKTHRI